MGPLDPHMPRCGCTPLSWGLEQPAGGGLRRVPAGPEAWSRVLAGVPGVSRKTALARYLGDLVPPRTPHTAVIVVTAAVVNNKYRLII